MKKQIILLLLFLSAPLVAQDAFEHSRYITYPKTLPGENMEEEGHIQRGEYLSKAGNCISCHTAPDPNAKPFAGNLGLKTPFGTFYSHNITPDKKTGIGLFTEDQFLSAMQNGRGRHGEFYFPVFPYLYFHQLNDKDIMDIKTYLFHLPPIEEAKKKNDVPFPFNIRFLQLGWRILFFYWQAEPFKSDPQQSAEWNMGSYLVNGLGHCGMCHTPLNLLGAPKTKYFLRGGFVDGFYAPDITGEALKDVRVEELINLFKHDQRPGSKGQVHGPMLEVNHNSLRYLRDEDLRAIAIYLKSVHSAPLPVKKSSGGSGESLYKDHCAVCHDTGAAAAPKHGDKAEWDARLKAQGFDNILKRAIEGYGSMPAKGACTSCSNEDIKAAVKYLVEGESNQVPKAPPMPRPSLQEGRIVFAKSCAQCHQKGNAQLQPISDKAYWKQRLFEHGMEDWLTFAAGNQGKPHACETCTPIERISAALYFAQSVAPEKDFQLWTGGR